MDQVAVVTVRDSVVDEIKLFAGAEKAAMAEKWFLEKLRESISNFAEYTSDDIDAILEQGYERWGTGNSVNIIWL